MVFPMVIRVGSVGVKIYKVENKGRDCFTVAYVADGKRRLKMFADFAEAEAEARSKAVSLSKGELDVLELRSGDRFAYVHAVEALRPTGVALELAAKEYAEAWRALGGKASLLEAAQEFARRHLHELPDKLLPDAVAEMLEAKVRDGASKVYLKVLRFYLGQLAEAFHCQLRSVTTSQLSDFFQGMEVSGRSRNNARGTVGAFFKFCKERGWLPKDHDGIALVPKFKEQATDIEIFTPQEIADFLAHSRPEMVPFLTIGAFAGLRSAEIERLDWKEVHLAERFIEVKAAKSKTASRRLVPITENLAQWLAPHAQAEGRVVPFANISKQIGWLVEDTNRGLKEEGEARRETGGRRQDGEKAKNTSPRPSPQGGEGDGVKVAAGKALTPSPSPSEWARVAPSGAGKARTVEWKANALRHSFISYRVADIQNVNQVALECGNSPAIIFKHYRELVRPAEAKKWFGIVPEAEGVVMAMPQAEAA